MGSNNSLVLGSSKYLPVFSGRKKLIQVYGRANNKRILIFR